jgi:hypothetical protein
MLISHFNDEEFLLPYWIQHHAPHFDHAILIDFNSTDRSVDIIKSLAPISWRIVKSRTGGVFDAQETDNQVVEWEKRYPDEWHLALTTTEFLVHRDLRTMLAALDPPRGESRIIKFPAAHMVGDDSVPMKRFGGLVEQRSVYDRKLANGAHSYGRYAHTGYRDKYHYSTGRHQFFPKPPDKIVWPVPVSGFILKYSWSPWPDIKNRKMQIGAHIPESDLAGKAKKGTQHIRNMDPTKLEEVRAHAVNYAKKADLKKAMTCDENQEDCLQDCSACATTCACSMHEQYHDAIDPAQPIF